MIDLNHLEKYRENNRIEAKKALGGLPRSIWGDLLCFCEHPRRYYFARCRGIQG